MLCPLRPELPTSVTARSRFLLLRPATVQRARSTRHYACAAYRRRPARGIGRTVNSPRLEEFIKPLERVVIVVPDATRAACVNRIAPLLVERLNRHGLSDRQISFLIGGGIHRAPTAEGIYTILGSGLPARIEVHPHDANDAASHASLGTTARGTPVVLNRRLIEADRTIVVGAISLHYIAGFWEVAKPSCRVAQRSVPYRPITFSPLIWKHSKTRRHCIGLPRRKSRTRRYA